MRLSQISFLLIVVALMFLLGCTHFQQTLTGEEQSFSATKPENIEVYFSNAVPTRPYKEVGYIVAEKENTNDAVAFIKEKAASMGADALLNCEVKVHTLVIVIIIFPIPISNYIASGVAVKYTN